MAIHMNYEELNNKLNILTEYAKGVAAELEKMDEIIENLGIFWESEASANYALRITADMANTRITIKAVALNLMTLYEVIERFDEVERFVISEF